MLVKEDGVKGEKKDPSRDKVKSLPPPKCIKRRPEIKVLGDLRNRQEGTLQKWEALSYGGRPHGT